MQLQNTYISSEVISYIAYFVHYNIKFFNNFKFFVLKFIAMFKKMWYNELQNAIIVHKNNDSIILRSEINGKSREE